MRYDFPIHGARRSERAWRSKQDNTARITRGGSQNKIQKVPIANKHLQQWGLVLAGAADFARPAKDLSLSQNAALTATGLIWTRWCFIIKPRNLFLASVNFLLFCVGATQTTRVLMYNASQKNENTLDAAKDEANKDVSAVEKIVEDPKAALKSVTNPK